MNCNWACIGCGHIANEMAQAFEQKGRSFYCVYSRTRENAENFAMKYNIKKVCGSAEEIFEDENIDIVYIATPHNRHIEYIVKAAQAGKHILCEKAITLNSRELALAKKVCEENGVILAEAMTIFHMPVYKTVLKYIEDKTLGKTKLVEVNLGSDKQYDMKNRFFNPDLAGGAMLDIGVYALSFIRFFLSENANDIKSSVKLAPTGVDEQAVLILSNSKNEMASALLSLKAKLPKKAVVSFENGYVEFENYNRCVEAKITFINGKDPIEIRSDENISPLCYEIEDMEEAVSGEKNNMRLDYTEDVMEIMTRLRNEWGVVYPEEKNNA
ncbi:MAG: Gfo/Idh/MocA family oxidoreductase [Eubacterium sp.]|nr:Gfo/Idh/MocA family oxidoreductase [Eubacterium sp.]